MTVTVECPKCGRRFNSIESYQNHTCGPRTLGGAGDVSTGSQETVKEGGTGEN